MMLKKYPFVKQTGIKDCGVACLQMIIKYYQGYISTRQLQDMTKTTKNGTTAYHLIEAAKQIGFDAKGIKAELSNIIKENMILPCIANVTIDNIYNHYIVIYAIDYKRKNLIIADPASKIKIISFEEFVKIWNRVFLFMYPIKKIPLYTKEQKPLRFLLNIILLNKKMIINIVLISICYAFYAIVGSYYLKYICDSFSFSQTKSYLIFIFILFLVFNILKLLSDFFRNQLLVYLNEKTELILTNNIFKSIILLPYNYYRNHTTGEITSRLNDLEKVRDLISKAIVFIFVDLPLALISFLLLYFISKNLFFISIVVFIMYIIVTNLFIPLFSNYIENVQQKKAEYTSYMIESITGFEGVKGIGGEKIIINKFEHKFTNFLKEIFNFQILYNKQFLFKEAICDISSMIIIFIGSLLILEQKLTLGSLLVFNSLFSYFLNPFKNTLELGILTKEASVAIKRILEIVESIKDNGFINKNIVGNIVFKNLNYSYDDRNLILKNITFSLKSNEKVMIIGKSGSGKSTLIKLLMRYYAIERGKIKIDNIDINDFSYEAIKENIIYISQHETLFNDTIYNNIDLENKASYEKFLEITNMCCVDDIVKNSNLGYNMLVEENGFNLSGGEAQRVVLARSLMRNFQILIIDEGLNQVDINLERKILKNLINTYSNKQIIVVSHRLENMDLFNRVIEFSNHTIKKDICKNDRNK